MKDLVITIAQALVDNPDQVEVSEQHDEDGITYELKVAPADLGKVIGKKGRTAKAIRTLLAASGMKSGQKARLKILEEEETISQAGETESAPEASAEETHPPGEIFE